MCGSTHKRKSRLNKAELQFQKCHTNKKIHSKVTIFADVKIDRFRTSQEPIRFYMEA